MKLITRDPIIEIAYLVIGIFISIYFIYKAKKRIHYYMFGVLGLVLMLNDICALLPSILNDYGLYMNDYLAMLGIGKAISTVLLVVLIVVSFWFYKIRFNKRTSIYLDLTVYVLAFLRILFAIIPADEVTLTENLYLYGFLRNIPLIGLGILTIVYTYKVSKYQNDEAAKCIFALILSLSLMSESASISFKSFNAIIVAILLPVTIVVTYLIATNYRSIRKKE